MAYFINAVWKRKQYYSFEKGVLSFCGHLCYTVLEGKPTDIQRLLDLLVKPFLPVLQPLATQGEKRLKLLISPQLGKAQCPKWGQHPNFSSKLWWGYGCRGHPACSTAQLVLDRCVSALAVSSTTFLLPRRELDSPWCLSQTVVLPSCEPCSPSESQHQKGRSTGSSAFRMKGII